MIEKLKKLGRKILHGIVCMGNNLDHRHKCMREGRWRQGVAFMRKVELSPGKAVYRPVMVVMPLHFVVFVIAAIFKLVTVLLRAIRRPGWIVRLQ